VVRAHQNGVPVAPASMVLMATEAMMIPAAIAMTGAGTPRWAAGSASVEFP
jgi:hypothetical protein